MDYEKIIAKHVREIKPSGIRKFFDIVGEFPDAISLGVGEPDFVTPWEIRDGAIKSVQKGFTAYTSNSGLPKLREAICAYLHERFSLSYEPGETIVTVGASEAIDLALRAVTEPGDEILIPDPSYVSYSPLVKLCGGTPVPVPCDPSDGFKLRPESLESVITPRTKAVILPYPNNPTGAVLTGEELELVCNVIKEHDLLAISDEIYAELTYGSRHVSAAGADGMRERTVLISGFSKAFAMTGWRIGYLCAPAPLTAAMLKIHQYAIMCAPTASQYAALAALKCGAEDEYATVEDMREKYDMRRRFVYAELNSMGLDCVQPCGAFYAFASVAKTGLDGEQFAEKLLRSKHVAVVPGSAFGLAGKYHVRCSYATSMPKLTEAMRRMGEFVAGCK